MPFKADSFTPDKPNVPEPRVIIGDLPQGVLANIPGALRETFGLEYRPGARTVGHTVYEPESIPEHLASMAITAPAIAGSGGLAAAARVPAVLGRIAAASGIGATRAAAESKDVGWGALLDAASAALTEGATAVIPKVKIPMIGKLGEAADKMAARTKAYEWAKEAPEKALDALRARLPKGKWLYVPTLAKKKITVDEAVDGLKKLEGLDYQTARAELISEFNALDAQRAGLAGSARKGPRPYAGQAFGIRTSPELFTPSKGSAFERLAAQVVPGLESTELRSIADALATQDYQGALAGLVGGATAAESGAENFGKLAQRIIGR